MELDGNNFSAIDDNLPPTIPEGEVVEAGLPEPEQGNCDQNLRGSLLSIDGVELGPVVFDLESDPSDTKEKLPFDNDDDDKYGETSNLEWGSDKDAPNLQESNFIWKSKEQGIEKRESI